MKRQREVDPSKYGFRWGQLDVRRMSEFKGQKAINIDTDYGSITVYVSPTGRSIRVFKNNKQELK